MNKPIFLSFLLVFMYLGISAQEDEFYEFKNKTESEFIDFVKQTRKTFTKFVEKNDKEFADFLRNSWDLYEGNEPEEPKLSKKPPKQPVIKKKEIKKVEKREPQEIKLKESAEPKPMRFGASLPPIQKSEEKLGTEKSVFISFYGLKPEFYYDPKLSNTLSADKLSSNTIADFWEAASECNHYTLINELTEFKNEHKLNDWAYYQLSGKVAHEISGNNSNQAKLLHWFLLLKSRYDAKVGYSADDIYLLVASEYMIFGKNYFSFDNKNYFVLDNENIRSLRSYDENYPGAKYKLNFKIDEAPVLGNDLKTSNLKFNYLTDKYAFEINYNKSNIDFYTTIPQLDLPVYFNAGNSTDFTNSLVANLKPLVKDLNEFTAVSFLLKFAQSAFDYKTDPQQFGYEKFFFAEETVFYPYSDCEDRSVFFAALVQELLLNEVIGLEYPGHVATAVKFENTPENGDYIMYKGEKYIICDPTFVNAPVGMCMPKFLNVEAKVIPLKAKCLIDNLKNEIKGIIVSAGGFEEDVQIEVDENGSSYVVSTYDQIMTIDNTKIYPEENSKNILLAKFDNNKNLVWTDEITAGEDFSTNFVKVSPEGSTYIAGLLGKKVHIGKKEFKKNSKTKQVFLAKYNKQGKFSWLKTSEIPQGADKNLIFVAKFTPEGEKVSGLLFEKIEAFDNYGISFTSKGDIVLTTKLEK